jgi:UDP-N-acetylglucosamine--N-acetylmuramyl-(pentapeptide) pyrophosphoryl-undecaprenol N-acetylglucosamine transferase
VFIIGGSLGAQVINDAVLSALPELVKNHQIVHQTGKANYDEVLAQSKVLLEKNEYSGRYKAFPFLNPMSMRMAAGIASVIVTRAGSMLFEVASWQVPAIVIPITRSNLDHQRKNAYNYARSGSGIVIEEKNLTPHIIINEIDRIVGDINIQNKMKQSAHNFYKSDAAHKIARKIIDIGLSHLPKE